MLDDIIPLTDAADAGRTCEPTNTVIHAFNGKNPGMVKKPTPSTESAIAGHANGIAVQLAEKRAHAGIQAKLTQEEKDAIIEQAARHYGEFLTALGCAWQTDPNSVETPMRVAKAYVNDLWRGRFEPLDDITDFPSDGYDGMVFEGGIPVHSMCSHHHQAIIGKAYIGYIPNGAGKVIGLSKLNRIVEHFARRGAIQEQLTVAIHHAINQICSNNSGVAVMIKATHNCVSCRGVKHTGASMKTSKMSGEFLGGQAARRVEFFEYCRQ